MSKAKRLEQKKMQPETQSQPILFSNSQTNTSLPSSQTDYVQPRQKSIYDTGELVAPPSVTEGTTKHLEINNEGETMTLPENGKR